MPQAILNVYYVYVLYNYIHKLFNILKVHNYLHAYVNVLDGVVEFKRIHYRLNYFSF